MGYQTAVLISNDHLNEIRANPAAVIASIASALNFSPWFRIPQEQPFAGVRVAKAHLQSQKLFYMAFQTGLLEMNRYSIAQMLENPADHWSFAHYSTPQGLAELRAHAEDMRAEAEAIIEQLDQAQAASGVAV